MINLFSKSRLLALCTLLTMSFVSAPVVADQYCCEPEGRTYIGAFGGGIWAESSRMTQQGTVFFTEAEGGALAVLAKGKSKSKSTGFGGVQLGYEWANRGCGCFTLTPAAEIEAYFFSYKKKGHLINPTLRLPEHDFNDSFKTNSSVILANFVFSIDSAKFWGFTPYVGGGLGAARMYLKDADSLQVSPVEPGVNHFNSLRHDSSWAFAGQVKAGVKYKICNAFNIFAEYRYLYVDSSNYIFGSTSYPDHAVTTPWNVKFKNINYNAFSIGFQYDL